MLPGAHGSLEEVDDQRVIFHHPPRLEAEDLRHEVTAERLHPQAVHRDLAPFEGPRKGPKGPPQGLHTARGQLHDHLLTAPRLPVWQGPLPSATQMQRNWPQGDSLRSLGPCFASTPPRKWPETCFERPRGVALTPRAAHAMAVEGHREAAQTAGRRAGHGQAIGCGQDPAQMAIAWKSCIKLYVLHTYILYIYTYCI